MKLEKTLTATLIALTILCPFIGYGITTTSDGSPVEVEFIDSESFTDIQADSASSKKQEAYLLRSIEVEFTKNALMYLPNGYTLKVRVTDIDLAGDRSLMTSRFADYRVLTDAYPPRIAFDYVVSDADGTQVAAGSKRLTDLAYRNNLKIAIRSDKTAAYVKELISNWAKGELRQIAKSK